MVQFSRIYNTLELLIKICTLKFHPLSVCNVRLSDLLSLEDKQNMYVHWVLCIQKSTVQLTSGGLTQAHLNYMQEL